MKLPRLSGPQSLRSRLTVWHGVVLGLVLVSFTVAVYTLLAQGLWSEMDRSLADRAQQVNNSVRLGPPFPRGGGASVEIPPPDRFASADTFVQVVTLNGEIVGASENLSGARLPVTDEYLASARAGAELHGTAQLGEERVRVFSAPLVVQGQPVGLVQVARSLDAIDWALGQLRLLAGAGLLVALGLSSAVVWVTTRTALRPLEQVIETADAIGTSGDLGRRVSTPSAGDEVGRLATTFNRMLGRLEGSAGALRAAYEQVEAALAAQRRFVADASHELRTPLTTIRSNAGLLSQYPNVTPDDRAAALDQISREAERMSRLVNELLTLVRADSGQTLARVPLALGPIVEDVAAQARVLSNEQHRISTNIADAGEVCGDPDALRQLALILLDNAVKYTPAGGQVHVHLNRLNGQVRLSVTDTGIGIAEEDLPHVFERFYRADRSRRAGGTGLGLAIAKWITEQHGGSISVTSSPRQGAAFTVVLPRLAPATLIRDE